jgi:flagellar motility protein MotE (MotC chaperone)
MTYDRLGKKIAPKPLADEDTGGGAATPNAARLARGGRVAAGPGVAMGGAGNPGAGNPGGGSQGARARATDPMVETAKHERMFRLRVLPLMLLVAVLVTGLKVEVLWDRKDEITAAFSVGTPALAQENTPPVEQLAQAPAASETPQDEKVDPFSLGKSQIELLQSLAERREQLEERERALILREGLLKAAEHRIENKIDELKVVKGEIEALIKTYDDQESDEIKSLVAIYEKMKPKDAARIFNELDMDVLLSVFQSMKSSKTAPVLAEMDANRAKEVTTRIAERRQMPTIN